MRDMATKKIRELRFLVYEDGSSEIRYVVKGGSREVIMTLPFRLTKTLIAEVDAQRHIL